MYLLLFLYYSYRYHRDLLSFPTRRSSDLHRSLRPLPHLPGRLRCAGSPHVVPDGLPAAGPRSGALAGWPGRKAQPPGGGRDGAAPGGDRVRAPVLRGVWQPQGLAGDVLGHPPVRPVTREQAARRLCRPQGSGHPRRLRGNPPGPDPDHVCALLRSHTRWIRDGRGYFYGRNVDLRPAGSHSELHPRLAVHQQLRDGDRRVPDFLGMAAAGADWNGRSRVDGPTPRDHGRGVTCVALSSYGPGRNFRAGLPVERNPRWPFSRWAAESSPFLPAKWRSAVLPIVRSS